MISTVDEKIADLRKNQQDTLSRIQQAQATMQELTALAQRQQGALMVLEELSTDSSKDEDDTGGGRAYLADGNGDCSLRIRASLCRRKGIAFLFPRGGQICDQHRVGIAPILCFFIALFSTPCYVNCSGSSDSPGVY